MNKLTLLETISIIYILATNILGVISLIIFGYVPKKVSETIWFIWFGVAMPPILPIVLYILISDKWKRRKRKQFDDIVKEKENDRNIS